jgi:hypothetical protein
MIVVLLTVLAVVDVALLATVYVILHRGIRFRSLSMRFIAVLSIAAFLLGFVFSFISWNVPFSMLLSVTAGCYAFLSGCAGAWLSDRQLARLEKKMAERPDLKEAFEKNFILRNVDRLGRWQRRE